MEHIGVIAKHDERWWPGLRLGHVLDAEVDSFSVERFAENGILNEAVDWAS